MNECEKIRTRRPKNLQDDRVLSLAWEKQPPMSLKSVVNGKNYAPKINAINVNGPYQKQTVLQIVVFGKIFGKNYL